MVVSRNTSFTESTMLRSERSSCLFEKKEEEMQGRKQGTNKDEKEKKEDSVSCASLEFRPSHDLGFFLYLLERATKFSFASPHSSNLIDQESTSVHSPNNPHRSSDHSI